ncbi:hypothetical protein HDV00_002996 [Rhizophlyctis rosea]|nr:hypothetical protein HDV00_002996 [Rhizophlyctis rosea]
MPGQTGGIVTGQRGKVGVGRSYLILHPDDVELAKGGRVGRVGLVGGDMKPAALTANRWIEAICTRCHSPLGECFYDLPKEGEPIANNLLAVKLYKYCVDSVTSLPNTVTYKPFISHLADDLLENASVHATYRFSVTAKERGGDEEGGPDVLLWLVNWNMLVGGNAAGGGMGWGWDGAKGKDKVEGKDGEEEIEVYPVMKVLYLNCPSTPLSPEHAKLIETFMQDRQQVENLKFHGEFVKELVEGLRSTSRILPPRMRKSGEWDVGFLERGV